MKAQRQVLFVLIGLLLTQYCCAQSNPSAPGTASAIESTPAGTIFPPVNWVSQNQSDVITIQNGNGIPLVIVLTVNGNTDPDAPGIIVRNCGTATHIKPGSSTICYSNDPNNPVNFNSESIDTAVSGTYQVQQK